MCLVKMMRKAESLFPHLAETSGGLLFFLNHNFSLCLPNHSKEHERGSKYNPATTEIIHCEIDDALVSYPKSAGVFCKFPTVISP